MSKHDYIIAGGGCAGLSLAYHLLQSQLSHKKILIIDRSPKKENDRTWSFWSEKPMLFDNLIFKSWRQLQFKSPDWTHTFDLGDWRYNMIRGIDFYDFVKKELEKFPNVTWVFGEIEAIDGNSQEASIRVNGKTYTGDWLFDSTFSPTLLEKKQPQFHYLQQHFKGYVIKSPKAIFNPKIPVLFDFNMLQEQAVRFVYILPHSPNKALVEFTVFSKELLPPKAYDVHLKNYLKNTLQLEEYDIEEQESGVIPMTDHPLPPDIEREKKIMRIGTKGGRCKPSTGYAFLRIQLDSERIVDSLQKTHQPFYAPISPKRFQLFDSILLNIMQTKGELIRPIFVELFKNNPIQRVFRFLNEETSLVEDVKVMNSVPTLPFLKAVWRMTKS